MKKKRLFFFLSFFLYLQFTFTIDFITFLLLRDHDMHLDHLKDQNMWEQKEIKSIRNIAEKWTLLFIPIPPYQTFLEDKLIISSS